MDDLATPNQRDSAPVALLPPPSGRVSARAWIVGVVLVLAIGAFIWWLVAGRAPAPPTGRGRQDMSRPFPVVAAKVVSQDIEIILTALGNVVPRNVVTVRARVDGQLLSVGFTEGQLVHAGELLAQIDPRPFEVQLTQANGQMARDAALLQNAKLDLQRYQTLLAQDSIAKQQVDTQEALVHQYQGAVQSDQGAIENAKLQLVYARVTAPLTGRVGLRQVDPGNVVHATDANGLVVITQVQPITVIFTLPEDDLPLVIKRIKSGSILVVEAYDRAGANKLATGKLLSLDNQIDTTTGTVKLKAEFPNDDGALFPNQFVNVRVHVDTQHGAIVAPTPSIQRGSQGTFVYVVNEDHSVSVRLVKLGVTQGELQGIASGLTAGETVVVDGTDKLREGAKVEVITRDSPTAPDAANGAGTRQRRNQDGSGGKEPDRQQGNRAQPGGPTSK